MPRDGGADASLEEPVDHAGLAAADDDQVGVALLGERDDDIGCVSDSCLQLGSDSALRQERARVLELLPVVLGRVGRSTGPPPRGPWAPTGATLVTISFAPNVFVRSAARASARLAGSVSSYATTIVFIVASLESVLGSILANPSPRVNRVLADSASDVSRNS